MYTHTRTRTHTRTHTHTHARTHTHTHTHTHIHQITLPQDSIVLDAQSTTDDRGEEGLSFHWEEVSGPLGSDLEADTPVLKLSGLSEGAHVYKYVHGIQLYACI